MKGRHAAFSILSGILFGAGWWVFIDGYASCGGLCSATASTQGYAWIPLFGATLVFLMINGMKWSELRADDLMGDNRTAAKARVFLLFALLIACACMAGAAIIMSDKFLRVAAEPGVYTWSGVSCFVGTLMILAATFLMRFGTTPPPDA